MKRNTQSSFFILTKMWDKDFCFHPSLLIFYVKYPVNTNYINSNDWMKANIYFTMVFSFYLPGLVSSPLWTIFLVVVQLESRTINLATKLSRIELVNYSNTGTNTHAWKKRSFLELFSSFRYFPLLWLLLSLCSNMSFLLLLCPKIKLF